MMGRQINYAILILLLLVIASSEISFDTQQSFLIFVSDTQGAPEQGADCAVKLTYPNQVIRQNATEVADIYEILNPDISIFTSRYGYYRIDVESGFESFTFACLSADGLRTAVLDVDAQSIPCDVSGEFLVC